MESLAIMKFLDLFYWSFMSVVESVRILDLSCLLHDTDVELGIQLVHESRSLKYSLQKSPPSNLCSMEILSIGF